jgi:hypothetical protein
MYSLLSKKKDICSLINRLVINISFNYPFEKILDFIILLLMRSLIFLRIFIDNTNMCLKNTLRNTI